jgi:hypothetical protein
MFAKNLFRRLTALQYLTLNYYLWLDGDPATFKARRRP